jgi:radical SAM superfamily enzyme YgiQ (UPF0313 family)
VTRGRNRGTKKLIQYYGEEYARVQSKGRSRVALINPPSPYLANDESYPPSGLMYLAASLEAVGHDVEILDFAGGRNWRAELPKVEADLYGVTCVTPNFNTVRDICVFIHDQMERPVIVGGAHPTFMPADTLTNMRCDAIVRGEGEVVVRRVMEDLKRGHHQRNYYGGNVSIEDIPVPARHLVDLHRYTPGGEKATPVYTSRGCPWNCAFCSRITGRTYRALPVKRVVEEVEEVKSLGFDMVVFGDDNIRVNPHRLRELLWALKPLDISFRLNQDARAIEEDIIALAADVGCVEISFGIESGSQRMLDAMSKRVTVEENRRAIEVCHRHGIEAKAYFIVNFPGEDVKSVNETLDFADETRPDRWLLSNFAPLPGCDVFSHPERYGVTWLSHDWEDYYLVGRGGSFRPCFRTEELTFARQRQLHDLAYGELKEILG